MANKLIPFGYRTPHADEHLNELMRDPMTVIVETRYTPIARGRPQFNRWFPSGLYATFENRYYWFSDASYGGAGGTGNDENWLGNRNYRHPELGIELVNEEEGLKALTHLIWKYDVILLCGCPRYEQCHRKVIADKLIALLPEVEVVLDTPTLARVEQGRLFS